MRVRCGISAGAAERLCDYLLDCGKLPVDWIKRKHDVGTLSSATDLGNEIDRSKANSAKDGHVRVDACSPAQRLRDGVAQKRQTVWKQEKIAQQKRIVSGR